MTADDQERGPTFQRLRPRDGTEPGARRGRTGVPLGVAGRHDPEGKRLLFSSSVPRVRRGTVVVDCPRCGARSVLSLTQALWHVVPSIHLPVFRHGSWMQCPACFRRGWLRARVRL